MQVITHLSNKLLGPSVINNHDGDCLIEQLLRDVIKKHLNALIDDNDMAAAQLRNRCLLYAMYITNVPSFCSITVNNQFESIAPVMFCQNNNNKRLEWNVQLDMINVIIDLHNVQA